MGFGYAKLYATDSPAGSMSAAVSLTHPIVDRWSVGPKVAFNLLGSRTVERGSLIASLDYSALEVGVMAHYVPTRLGPISLLSFGPELMSARADLSTTGGGAAFSDLAVHETAGAVAFDATLMQHKAAPVRVGLEFGGRYAFLTDEDWFIADARLVFHY